MNDMQIDPIERDVLQIATETREIWRTSDKQTRRDARRASDVYLILWRWTRGEAITIYNAARVLRHFGYRLKIEKINDEQ